MRATVLLYLMTTKKIVRLERKIDFVRVPCVGEWLRFRSSALFPAMITEITHDEAGNVEVVIGAQKEDGRYMFHETDEDFYNDIDDLIEAGWIKMSEKENTFYKKDGI